MSHEDGNIISTISTTPVSFLETLPFLSLKVQGTFPTVVTEFNRLTPIQPSPGYSPDAFFQSITPSNLYASGATPYENFVNMLWSKTGEGDVISNMFAYDYSVLIHTSNNPTEQTIWGQLNPPMNPSVYSPYNPTIDPNTKTQFQKWFNHFLSGYTFNSSGNAGTMNDFMTQAGLSMTDTAVLSENTNISVPGGGALPQYQNIFKSFFPSATTTDFINYLQNFYTQTLNANGYFIPSQVFPAFINQVQYDYTQSQGPTLINPGQSNLAPADFNLTAVLDRIYALIKDMLGSMQKIAAVQANRLTVLTNWQQAYTTELTQLKTFLMADVNTHHGLPTFLDQTHINSLNDLNSTLRQQVTTNQSVVSDDAKSLQSNINQSTDAVTQQANMATSIIQELSTLLGAIFR